MHRRWASLLRLARSLALALAAPVTLGSCGDNGHPMIAPLVDATVDADVIPSVPGLGPQLDRAGRPLAELALIGAFLDTPPADQTKRQAYYEASDPATWAAVPVAPGRSIAAEIAVNLGVLDMLDTGNASIPTSGTTPPGCRNQVLYNGTPAGGGQPAQGSYQTLALLLADDMLYVDTSKTSCAQYLSLELEAATGGTLPHTQCGGRTPRHDVVDITYSLLISGLVGLVNPTLAPRLVDGAAAHADVSETVFPYFGSPR